MLSRLDLDFLQSHYRDYKIYSRVLPFMHSNAHLPVTSAVHHGGAKAMQTLREIQEIEKSVVRQLREKCEEFQRQTTHFLVGTFKVPFAYEGGDLLSVSSIVNDCRLGSC